MGQEKTQSIYKQLIGLLFCDLLWGWFKLFRGYKTDDTYDRN